MTFTTPSLHSSITHGALLAFVLVMCVAGLCGNDARAQTRTHSTHSESFSAPVDTDAEADALSNRHRSRSATYVNSLGKAIQKVSGNSSPSGRDVVTPIVYDELGRETATFLPYVAGSQNAAFYDDALSSQSAFYASEGSLVGFPATAYPYAVKVMEMSPSETILEAGKAGALWQPGTGNTNRMEHDTNGSGEVPRFNVDASGLSSAGTYAPGTLAKTTTTDADGNKSITYTDRDGNDVRKESLLDGEPVVTHYVYDRHNRLRYVLPPKVHEELDAGTPLQVAAANWGTEYVYDDFGREVEKHMPEEEVVTTVYDRLGRVILRQDGIMRANGDWLFTKYDAYGRTVMTGIYQADPAEGRATDRDAMQAYVNQLQSGSSPALYEHPAAPGTANSKYGYTDRAFPTEDPLRAGEELYVWTVTDYDDYDFDRDGTGDAAFTADFPAAGGPVSTSTGTVHLDRFERFDRITGKTTRTRVRILYDSQIFGAGTYDAPLPSGPDTVKVGGPTTLGPGFQTNPGQVTVISPSVNETQRVEWVSTVSFFDRKGRTIQSLRTGPFATTRTSTRYTFSGQTHESVTTHTRTDGTEVTPGATSIVVRSRTEYDDGGRVKRVYQKNGSDAELLVAEHVYNELGTLVKKKLHSTDGGATFDQTVEKKQNVRGWATEKTVNAAGSLLYQHNLSYTGTQNPRYGGSVTRMEWQIQSGTRHAYDYVFDDLGRLSQAIYSGSGAGTYDLGATYDLHGNLATLTRKNGGLIDDLDYQYEGRGNQLTNVLDKSGHAEGFVQGTSHGNPLDQAYTYDENGNLLADHHKGLSVTYTYFNLPDEIDLGAGNCIDWLWTATGGVLRRTTLDAQGATRVKTYAGGFTYLDTDGTGPSGEALDHFGLPGGRVKAKDDGFAYQYRHTDHLGNTRVLYEAGTGAVQALAYYPYGLTIPGLHGLGTTEPSTNEDLYNGKELTSEHGLDWYHYGARFYDVARAQWTTMDPADEFHSPYVYVGGDPVNLVDPDGRASQSPSDVIPEGTAREKQYIRTKITHLRTLSPKFDRLYTRLDASDARYYITIGSLPDRGDSPSSYRFGTTLDYSARQTDSGWMPTQARSIIDVQKNLDVGRGEMGVYRTLSHEFGHLGAFEINTGGVAVDLSILQENSGATEAEKDVARTRQEQFPNRFTEEVLNEANPALRNSQDTAAPVRVLPPDDL